MRLFSAIARRAATSAMAVGLAVAGTVAMSAPSHAADNVTVTVRVTLTAPNTHPSVAFKVDGSVSGRNCHRGLVLGQARELSLTAPKGHQVTVYPSVHCYFLLAKGSTVITPERDGQVFDLTLE